VRDYNIVLNKVAADIPSQLFRSRITPRGAAMLVLTLFEDSEEIEAPSNGLRDALCEDAAMRYRAFHPATA